MCNILQDILLTDKLGLASTVTVKVLIRDAMQRVAFIVWVVCIDVHVRPQEKLAQYCINKINSRRVSLVDFQS